MVQAFDFTGLITLDARQAQKALRGFMAQMRGLNVVGRELSTIFRGAGFIASAIAIGKMAINASNFAKQMDIAAQKLGLASSKLVSMKNAFDSIGANGKNIEQIFNKIHQGMQSFKYGDGKFVAQLAAMGVSAFDGGRQRSDQDILYGIMNAAQRMRQSGRSEQEVADWLQKTVGAEYQVAQKMMMGATAFKQWQETTNQRVGVVQQRQLNNLTKLNESFHSLGTTLDILKNQIFGDIGPLVSWFVDIFQIAGRTLQDVWMALAAPFRELGNALGGEDGLNVLLKGLKVSLEYGLVIPLKIVAVVLKYLIRGIRKVGEFFGEVIAWLQDKFSWLFGDKTPSMEEAKQTAANTLALRVASGEITAEKASELSKKLGLPESDIMLDAGSTEDVVRAESVDGRQSITVYMNNEVNVDKQGNVETSTDTSATSGIVEEKVSNVTKTS